MNKSLLPIKVVKNADNVVNNDTAQELARIEYRLTVSKVHLLEELLKVAPEKSVLKKKKTDVR